MALSYQYSSPARQPFASPSSECTSTARKTPSGNSCKNLASVNSCKTPWPIQRWDQKLWPFQNGTQVWRDEPSASAISDSTSTSRKTASRNFCKNLMSIQRSDQKFWPFRTSTLVWRVNTSASSSSESKSTPRKTSSGNSC
jgi:hypothetical protein